MHLLLGLVAETVLSSILRSLCFQCLERALFTQDHMSVDEASTRSVMHDRKFVCAAIRRNSAAANLARKRELVNHDSSTHGETLHRVLMQDLSMRQSSYRSILPHMRQEDFCDVISILFW